MDPFHEGLVAVFPQIRQFLSRLLNAAVGSQGFQEAASDLRWLFHPARYQVVRTG